jgi:hypothetical protein
MRKNKDEPSQATMIRTAAAHRSMYSVAALANETGIPETTLRRKLKHFETLTVGELSALMRALPSITDEMMGKAVREAAR